eukprot:SAG11_NODE_18639_length_485_cov_0.803109_1_plen_126_part_00
MDVRTQRYSALEGNTRSFNETAPNKGMNAWAPGVPVASGDAAVIFPAPLLSRVEWLSPAHLGASRSAEQQCREWPGTSLEGTDEAQWRSDLASSPHLETLVGWLHEARVQFAADNVSREQTVRPL